MAAHDLDTRQVVEHHSRALGSGIVDDIVSDYTDESIVVTPDAVYKGRIAIRGAFETILTSLFKPGTYEISMDKVHIEGEIAYAVWHARCAEVDIPFGTDTFVIRNGKISVQTFAAKIDVRSDT